MASLSLGNRQAPVRSRLRRGGQAQGRRSLARQPRTRTLPGRREQATARRAFSSGTSALGGAPVALTAAERGTGTRPTGFGAPLGADGRLARLSGVSGRGRDADC